jgi:hypothetical protein
MVSSAHVKLFKRQKRARQKQPIEINEYQHSAQRFCKPKKSASLLMRRLIFLSQFIVIRLEGKTAQIFCNFAKYL